MTHNHFATFLTGLQAAEPYFWTEVHSCRRKSP